MLRSEAGLELIVEDEVRPEKQKRKAGVSGWAGGRAPGHQPWHRGQGRVEPWQGEERQWDGGWVWGQLMEMRCWGKWSCGPMPFAPLSG